jgi:hypothetical protein
MRELDMRELERRVTRLEQRTARAHQSVESWHIDGDVAVNQQTGETISAGKLAERPVPPDTMRIEIVFVDPPPWEEQSWP